MKTCVLTACFAAAAALAAFAAETTGSATFNELGTVQDDYWNTAGHANPTVGYVRRAADECEASLSVSGFANATFDLSGNDFDARIYYPSVLSSSILFSSFPTGMLLFIR